MRALVFLYGNGNIAGCALALAGPALLFAEFIGPGWWAITLGLYALGWLFGSLSARTPALERHIADTLSAEQMLSHLDDLIARAAPELTPAMNAHLASVRGSVAEVLTRLAGARQHDADLYTVRETVLRYLPETLANYVALPRAFRVGHVLRDGQTARELMAGQLALLDEQMQQIVANVARADAEALLANGRFLEAKFRQPDFLAR